MRKAIILGHVRPGQRLESCRTLARELEVSIGVIREAIAELRGEGLVEVRHGVGTFVVRRVRASRTLKASRRRASRRELEMVLRVIDPLLAAEAAKHVRPRQQADLRMRGEQIARSAWLGFDDQLDELHAALVDAIDRGRVTHARRAAQLISVRELHPAKPP